MNVAKPFEALLPSVDAAVIRALAGVETPRSGREIAHHANRSQPAVQAVLDRLVEQGLVRMTPAGRAKMYSMNRDHVAAGPMIELSDLRNELFRRIKGAVLAWTLEPSHISVFGSTARGDGGPESDIDVLAVLPEGLDPGNHTWRDQVETLTSAIERWSGNPARVIEVEPDDMKSDPTGDSQIWEEIRRDAIHVGGMSVRRVLEGGGKGFPDAVDAG